MIAARQNVAMIAGVGVAAAAVALFAAQAAPSVAVASLPAAACGAALLYLVLRGNRAATLLLLFATVFLMQAVFRIRAYDDKDIDFQVIIKMAMWVAVAAVAVVYVRRWAHLLLRPANLPALLFLLWLPLTAMVSPSPNYTLASSFTVVACVLACAFAFARFEASTVFLTILASVTLFCAISIVVYFALPEFGHYVYWLNEERFVSPRLAGIAGSANNMALIASFGLILVAIEARTLHRINPLLLPAAAAICGAALVMTNSRMALVMTGAIVVMMALLNWRRLYLGLFLVSTALLAAVAILPFGQDTLLKAVSRSGTVGEVTSFTGRTEIWYTVLKLAQMQPWMGYGYGSSVFVLPEHTDAIGFSTSHAHNLFLQLLLTTGGVGLLLFLMTVLALGIRAVAYRNRVIVVMLAFVVLNGLTESSGFTTLANICTLAFAIAVTYDPRRSRDEDRAAYQR
jgi:O-antigen ligase